MARRWNLYSIGCSYIVRKITIDSERRKHMVGLLWAIVAILVILWLVGLLVHIGGGLIHLLLVLAVIVLLYNLFVGSRARRLSVCYSVQTMTRGRQHACCIPPLIFCTFVFFYVSYPMPLRQGLVSELHRNSAYLCRRAALA